MTPWTLLGLDTALRGAWAADTCSPDDVERAAWTSDNPAWGHCDITALVVHDLFGGDLVQGTVQGADGTPQGHHWWNRLPTGTEFDLTREQFRRGQTVTYVRVVERPAGRLRRQEEYELLKKRVLDQLGPPQSGEPSHAPATTAS